MDFTGPQDAKFKGNKYVSTKKRNIGVYSNFFFNHFFSKVLSYFIMKIKNSRYISKTGI